ncbi:translation initiation factor IF-3 [Patescibacteria group bacterium]|nr:translation initiation factor IF-3 [Patescibacteria group bacterium]MBU1256145.1 translation initiation factor IF-3 [Patescibacteria group bacterium]MBU1457248.1 translation initiation factor IF-3 [Patescibacteria group bacterium]
MRKYHRTNQYITHPQVRVIDEANKQIGIMSSQEAFSLAKEQGLDLVEISDKAKPPIVKIIAFNKFKYLESKKYKTGQGKSAQDTKEVRFSPFMAENDLNTKIKKATKFLKGGDRVKLVVKFTGRQITKKDFGDRVMQYALLKLEDVAEVDQPPKLLGKLLIAQVKPKK